MDFKVAEKLHHPVRDVYLAYRDHLASIARHLPNVDSIEVLERQASGSRLLLANRWNLGSSLPQLLRHTVGQTALSYVDRAEWDNEELYAKWRIELSVFSQGVNCHGVTRFRPWLDAQGLELGTEVHVSGALVLHLAKVPGFGWAPQSVANALERTLVESLKPNLIATARAVDVFLSGSRNTGSFDGAVNSDESAVGDLDATDASVERDLTSDVSNGFSNEGGEAYNLSSAALEEEVIVVIEDVPEAVEAPKGTEATRERVVICQGERAAKELLREALLRSGFWEELERHRRQSNRSRRSFSIAIKTDMKQFDRDSSTGTSPELVEDLVLLLHEAGYSHVSIVSAPALDDAWFEFRDPQSIAERVGYRFTTDNGHHYEVLDLSEDRIAVAFDLGGALDGVKVSEAWVNAGFRVNFAKNKTHDAWGYSLCLANLLNLLPASDNPQLFATCAPDICTQLAKHLAPHFNLIDAIVSNHGVLGDNWAQPINTNTIIAGRSLLLTDWVGALRMKIDPYFSPVNARALRVLGLPQDPVIEGELSEYEGWVNVHPYAASAVRRMREMPGARHALAIATTSVNPDLFPFKSLGDKRINSWWTPLLKPQSAREVKWPYVALIAAIARGFDWYEAWLTQFAKEGLQQKFGPLPIDLSSYGPSEYEAVVGYIEELEALLNRTAPDASGLRWRYLEGSVLFAFSRVIAAPFEDFVERVDISKAVQYMRDYIGGSWVPVARDELGRVTYQAERSMYLAQPNYLAWVEGKGLDVTKLDFIRYEEKRYKIYWRAVGSENGSVEFDDGSVVFEDLGDEGVRVSVMARQKFTRPPLLDALHLDENPTLLDAIVSSEYRNFFRATMNNYEAQYEGRDFRVGRPSDGAGKSAAGPFDWLLPGLESSDLLASIRPLVASIGRSVRAVAADLGAEPRGKRGAETSEKVESPSVRNAGDGWANRLARLTLSMAGAGQQFATEMMDALAQDLSALGSNGHERR